MDDIFQLLYHSLTTLKEMEELTNNNHHGTKEYREKQNELNRNIIEIIRLMIFKKE